MSNSILKSKYGFCVATRTNYDQSKRPEINIEIEICRLMPLDVPKPPKDIFTTSPLIYLNTKLLGMDRPQQPSKYGVHPLAFPTSTWQSGYDAAMLCKFEWSSCNYLTVNVQTLKAPGCTDAMRLVCKAQELADDFGGNLYRQENKPLTENNTYWSLDYFTRLLIGLHHVGLRHVTPKDYYSNPQSFTPYQFDADLIRGMWDSTNMIRAMSEQELIELGAIYA